MSRPSFGRVFTASGYFTIVRVFRSLSQHREKKNFFFKIKVESKVRVLIRTFFPFLFRVPINIILSKTSVSVLEGSSESI